MSQLPNFAVLFVGVMWVLGLINLVAGSDGIDRTWGGIQTLAALLLLWNIDGWLMQ